MHSFTCFLALALLQGDFAPPFVIHAVLHKPNNTFVRGLNLLQVEQVFYNMKYFLFGCNSLFLIS